MLLVAVNLWPGWWALPFVTERLTLVLGLVNLSPATGVVANLVARAPWVRPLGDLVTTAIGLAALVRVRQVFPFAFPESGVDRAAVLRVGLVVAAVLVVVALAVQVVALVRAFTGV